MDGGQVENIDREIRRVVEATRKEQQEQTTAQEQGKKVCFTEEEKEAQEWQERFVEKKKESAKSTRRRVERTGEEEMSAPAPVTECEPPVPPDCAVSSGAGHRKNRCDSGFSVWSRYPNCWEFVTYSLSPCDLCGDCGSDGGGVCFPCRICASDACRWFKRHLSWSTSNLILWTSTPLPRQFPRLN